MTQSRRTRRRDGRSSFRQINQTISGAAASMEIARAPVNQRQHSRSQRQIRESQRRSQSLCRTRSDQSVARSSRCVPSTPTIEPLQRGMAIAETTILISDAGKSIPTKSINGRSENAAKSNATRNRSKATPGLRQNTKRSAPHKRCDSPLLPSDDRQTGSTSRRDRVWSHGSTTNIAAYSA